MFNLGPTEFPLTHANVHVILPSLMTSIKLASFGEVIGTVQQDRATAVAGRLGSGPKMIPMSITLNSDRMPSRTFSFSVVKDQTFTPLLTYLTVANVLTSYERGAGPASFTVKGTASIREHGDIAFEDIFTGDQPAGAASAYVAGPITFLLRNASEPVDVERLTLSIDATEQPRTARIDRVWLDTERPRAGRGATVKVLLRTNKGEEILKSVPIQIPANASGSLQLLVADASRLTAEDRRQTAWRRNATSGTTDSHVQSGEAQQSSVRATLGVGRRHRRQRRTNAGASPIGPRRYSKLTGIAGPTVRSEAPRAGNGKCPSSWRSAAHVSLRLPSTNPENVDFRFQYASIERSAFPMPTPVRRALMLGLPLALLTSWPLLATPGFWHAGTQADFLRGDVEHLSIDEHGRLMLGPEARRIYEAGVPFVWTMLPGPDESVFLGPGTKGR